MSKVFSSNLSASDGFSRRLWSISWRPSLWRILFLTEVCCMKGNWCSQVCKADLTATHLCSLTFYKESYRVRFGPFPENTKLIDAYLFLFDEFLLITKIKRNKKVQPVDVSLNFPTVNICCTEATVRSMCAEVCWSGAEPPEAAAEPGAGAVSEGGIHLHSSGSASFSRPTPAQEYWPAQCFK